MDTNKTHEVFFNRFSYNGELVFGSIENLDGHQIVRQPVFTGSLEECINFCSINDTAREVLTAIIELGQSVIEHLNSTPVKSIMQAVYVRSLIDRHKAEIAKIQYVLNTQNGRNPNQ